MSENIDTFESGYAHVAKCHRCHAMAGSEYRIIRDDWARDHWLDCGGRR